MSAALDQRLMLLFCIYQMNWFSSCSGYAIKTVPFTLIILDNIVMIILLLLLLL